MITFFITSTTIVAMIGYLILNVVFFPTLWKQIVPARLLPTSAKTRLFVGLLSIALPVLVTLISLWIASDIGVCFTSFNRGVLWANGVFPAISSAFICLLWLFVHIGKTLFVIVFKKNEQLIEAATIAMRLYGAAMLGSLTVIAISILSLFLIEYYDINSRFFDLSRKHIQEINLYFFAERIRLLSGGIGFLIFLCFLAGKLCFWCFPKIVVEGCPEKTVRRFSIGNFLAVIVWIVLSLWFSYAQLDFFPSIYDANMRRISRALESYQYKNGTLPPVYTTDADGKPLHSWRVLILPYLDLDEKHQKFFENVRLDEPWNSEHNRQFHFAVPEVFQTPERYKKRKWVEKRTLCDCSVITGPKTLFSNNELLSMENVKDRTTTVLVVERISPIPWMDPTQELTEECFRKYEKTDSHTGLRVLFADGHVEKWKITK